MMCCFTGGYGMRKKEITSTEEQLGTSTLEASCDCVSSAPHKLRWNGASGSGGDLVDVRSRALMRPPLVKSQVPHIQITRPASPPSARPDTPLGATRPSTPAASNEQPCRPSPLLNSTHQDAWLLECSGSEEHAAQPGVRQQSQLTRLTGQQGRQGPHLQQAHLQQYFGSGSPRCEVTQQARCDWLPQSQEELRRRLDLALRDSCYEGRTRSSRARLFYVVGDEGSRRGSSTSLDADAAAARFFSSRDFSFSLREGMLEQCVDAHDGEDLSNFTIDSSWMVDEEPEQTWGCCSPEGQL